MRTPAGAIVPWGGDISKPRPLQRAGLTNGENPLKDVLSAGFLGAQCRMPDFAQTFAFSRLADSMGRPVE